MKKLFLLATLILGSLQVQAADYVLFGDHTVDTQNPNVTIELTNAVELGNPSDKAADVVTTVNNYVASGWLDVTAKHIISVGTHDLISAINWLPTPYAPWAHFPIQSAANSINDAVTTLQANGVTDITVVVPNSLVDSNFGQYTLFYRPDFQDDYEALANTLAYRVSANGAEVVVLPNGEWSAVSGSYELSQNGYATLKALVE